MKKYTLFIGLNDKDTYQQEITTIDAYKMLNRILPDCTIQEGKGIYTHRNGTKTIETTLIVSVFDFESDFDLKSTVSRIKETLNQESVVVVTEQVNSELL